MPEKQVELKPCPFCGGNAKIYCCSIDTDHDTFSKTFKIKCERCGAEFPKRFSVYATIDNSAGFIFDAHERDLVTKAWNRRFSDGSDGKEREGESNERVH